MTTNADCVIVGGGIGGAALALALGQQGRRVVVLERDALPPRIGRPEILARSTMETFHRLGVGTRMLQEAALPLQGLELHEAGDRPLLSVTREEFHHAEIQPYSTDPARTRQILLEQAQATAAIEVQRGVEVQGLVREGPKVVGVRAMRQGQPLTWMARVVVGDDGAQSRVRIGLGIPLKTREFALEFLSAAGRPAAGPVPTIGQAWIEPRRLRSGIFGCIAMPLPHERVAVVFLASPASCRGLLQYDHAAFHAAVRRLSPSCADVVGGLKFPDEFLHIRRPFGHAPAYAADGAALLGDAAHPVTPAGGQGANMSVADAVVLAEVIEEGLKRNDTSANQLARYESRRRPANERALAISARADRVFRLLGFVPALRPLLLWQLKQIDRDPITKLRVLRGVSQAFVE